MSEIPAQLRRLSEVLQSKTGSARCWQAVGRGVKKQWPDSHSKMWQRSRHFYSLLFQQLLSDAYRPGWRIPSAPPKSFQIRRQEFELQFLTQEEQKGFLQDVCAFRSFCCPIRHVKNNRKQVKGHQYGKNFNKMDRSGLIWLVRMFMTVHLRQLRWAERENLIKTGLSRGTHLVSCASDRGVLIDVVTCWGVSWGLRRERYFCSSWGSEAELSSGWWQLLTAFGSSPSFSTPGKVQPSPFRPGVSCCLFPSCF